VIAMRRPERANYSQRCERPAHAKRTDVVPRSAKPRVGAAGDSEGSAARWAYLMSCREVLPHNAIVTDELSQAVHVLVRFPVYEPRSFITQASGAPRLGRFPAHSAKVAHSTGRWSRSPAMAASCSRAGIGDPVQFTSGVVTLVFNNNASWQRPRDQRERFDRPGASDSSVKLMRIFGVAVCARHLTRDI